MGYLNVPQYKELLEVDTLVISYRHISNDYRKYVYNEIEHPASQN